MQSVRKHSRLLSATLGLLLMASSSAAFAQYQVVNLVSDLPGKAQHQDALLKNPWGLAYGPGGAFWVSDEASGWSTLYDGTGNPESLQVIVPPASGTGAGTPTGIVFNGSSDFTVGGASTFFLFATLDGTISGWTGTSSSIIAVSNPGAVYTGLAITSKTSGNSLFAADIANNKVDVYDGSFNLINSFTDAKVPAGFAPFGIQDIDGQVYVAYASQTGGAGGYIDVFSEEGVLVQRLAHGAPLNQPWGLAVAPKNFGPLSGALLISNNTGTGTINGFNLKSGKLVGTMMNRQGKPLLIDGIWGIEFGGGTAANGATNQLFFTAGPADTDGSFGAIIYRP